MYENMNEMNVEEKETIDWSNVQVPKKESFFKKHGFVLGFLSSLLCVVLVCAIMLVYLNLTGNILIVGETGASAVKSEAVLDQEMVEKIDELYSYMNVYYYEDIDKETIAESLYSGLLNSLEDPYSVYYTAEEYEDMMVSTSGTYCGIGAGVSQNLTTMEVTITKVYKGTPAEEAGLKDGDMILSVDGLEAVTVGVDELVQNIRGEEGT
ncbi:MAG: PDZ domain-containing protein, partial [Agathobacter sp.]|nr:PDZ domain-containing protein [Agathobacter sp.]